VTLVDAGNFCVRAGFRDNPAGKMSRKFLALLGLSAEVYALAVRPRTVRWGASDEEVQQPYPGAGLIPGGVLVKRARARSSEHEPRPRITILRGLWSAATPPLDRGSCR
jgi:hypothetical protein